MFSNVGWGEIILLLIVGLILIGPERLPKLIQDLRVWVEAARQAIANARESLDGEFKDELEEFRKPLGELGDLRRLNPKTAIARTLFDNDDTYLDLLTGKPLAGGGGAAGAAAAKAAGAGKSGSAAPGSANSAAAAQDRARQSADMVSRGQDAARARREGAGSDAAQGTARPVQQGERHGDPGGSSWVSDDVL
ncbi:Sec-independent protein translocase protein TatB [Corynebacterium sp. 335C]